MQMCERDCFEQMFRPNILSVDLAKVTHIAAQGKLAFACLVKNYAFWLKFHLSVQNYRMLRCFYFRAIDIVYAALPLPTKDSPHATFPRTTG